VPVGHVVDDGQHRQHLAGRAAHRRPAGVEVAHRAPLAPAQPLLRLAVRLPVRQHPRGRRLDRAAELGTEHVGRQQPEMRLRRQPVEVREGLADGEIAAVGAVAGEGEGAVGQGVEQRLQQRWRDRRPPRRIVSHLPSPAAEFTPLPFELSRHGVNTRRDCRKNRRAEASDATSVSPQGPAIPRGRRPRCGHLAVFRPEGGGRSGCASYCSRWAGRRGVPVCREPPPSSAADSSAAAGPSPARMCSTSSAWLRALAGSASQPARTPVISSAP